MCTHMRMHLRETYLCRADARSVKVYAQSSAAEQKTLRQTKYARSGAKQRAFTRITEESDRAPLYLPL